MPHVAPKTVKKDVFVRMSRELVSLVANTQSKQEAKAVLNELLTPTEKVMLAKRLALLLMIKKGYAFATIERTLKMSPTTISRFWKENKKRSHPILDQLIEQAQANKKFWDSVEVALRLGMPPMGRKRWDFLNTENLRKSRA